VFCLELEKRFRPEKHDGQGIAVMKAHRTSNLMQRKANQLSADRDRLAQDRLWDL
jgi:hypothetical protein